MNAPDESDYVVIGAGSAGCVLANRLSADGSSTVTLLEAGGDDRPLHEAGRFRSNLMIHIPVGYAETLKDPAINWLFLTDPDPGSAGRVHVWPRGKVLGGSSSINAMLYVRGQATDFDRWRREGCEGWAWSEVLPYFRRAENQQHGACEFHGAGGPLHVADQRDGHPVSDAVIAACEQAGIPRSRDINGPSQEGAAWFQVTQKHGRRDSTAVAYLNPVRRRTNLRIQTHALATRILFSGRRATGVEILRDGVKRVLHAKREIILAAGAINSPQLLQLSGIGPGGLLAQYGIPVINDAPGVGANLQDHYMAGLRYRLKPGTPSLNAQSRGWRLGVEALRYVFARRGLLSLAAAHVGIFCRSRADVIHPDIQFHVLPATIDLEHLIKNGELTLENEPGLSLIPCQLRPESRGSVHIVSADPLENPAIRPNYLHARLDQEVLVAGLRWTQRIAAQPALASLIDHPLERHLVHAGDSELLDHARATGATAYHPVGTCRMGAGDDAVVDTRLRVAGTGSLRVVDASIMPTLVSGNTNASTIMIAEKAADLIIGERSNRG